MKLLIVVTQTFASMNVPDDVQKLIQKQWSKEQTSLQNHFTPEIEDGRC
ncbi:MAG: hypothetical protein AAFW67_01465 [Cyanobacteria bacterium J06638_38]